jgi:serine/threonine protein kinase
MGIVYNARQISLNRGVALKMIASGQLAGDAEVRRFKTEAEAAAKLDHPNIVPVYEIGIQEGRHYFSMRRMSGGSLGEWQPEGGDRNAAWLRRAAHLIAVVAHAVHYAHQRGILHRDIKPTNILFDRRGEPHLSDFGAGMGCDNRKPNRPPQQPPRGHSLGCLQSGRPAGGHIRPAGRSSLGRRFRPIVSTLDEASETPWVQFSPDGKRILARFPGLHRPLVASVAAAARNPIDFRRRRNALRPSLGGEVSPSSFGCQGRALISSEALPQTEQSVWRLLFGVSELRTLNVKHQN